MIVLPRMRYLEPEPHVPLHFHQIWIGSPAPAWVRRNWDEWDQAFEHSPWRAVRWDDTGAATLMGAWLWDRLAPLTPRCRADLLRVFALYYIGGVYMDSDAIPLWDQHQIAKLGHEAPQGWIGTGPRTLTKKVLSNASFGVPRGSAFLDGVWARASAQLSRGVTRDHNVAGPMTFHWVHQRMAPGLAPVVLPTFENVEDPDVMKAMRSPGNPPVIPYDYDELRARYPASPVLNVMVNYGTWKGRHQ